MVNIIDAMNQADALHGYGENTHQLSLVQVMVNFEPPAKTDELHLCTRRIPECLDTVLPKMVSRVKAINSKKKINQKNAVQCAIELGFAKFVHNDELRSQIETRYKKAQHCKSKAEKKVYMDMDSEGVLLNELREIKSTYQYHISERVSNWAGTYASCMKMSKYELLTMFFCIGVVNGNDESKYSEEERICDWELEEMTNIISACMAHLTSLEDEVRAFERKQNMKGQKFTF